MQHHRILYLALTAAILLVLGTPGKAQDNLKKEVQVVRPYEPSISDAFKINLQPKIEDTIKVSPSFAYSILQHPINTHFAPNPISAARMVSEPLGELYSTFVKVGFGNATLPMAEVYYNSKRSENLSYGVWLRHSTGIGKVRLDNDQKVDARNSHTGIGLFGKRAFAGKVFLGSLGYSNSQNTYYGYDTDNPLVAPTSDRQKVNRLNANLELATAHRDSAHLNYRVGAAFEHLGDKYDMQENKLNASLAMNKYLKQEQFGGEASLTHLMQNQALDTGNNTVLRVSPWVKFFGPQWRVLVGVGLAIDNNSGFSQPHLYPKGFASYDVVSHYFIPYLEVGGFLEENPYSKILAENPWAMPGVDVWNTSHRLILTGGVKGKFSPTVSYNVHASYSVIDSMYFYINADANPANPLMNRFSADFDNMEQTKILGELSVEPSEKLSVLLHAEYFSYKVHNLAHPWHKPDYSAFANLRYNIKNKVVTTLHAYSVGKRWGNVNAPKQLGGFVDLNLGLEYNYNQRLSAFLNLNNILNAKYHIWHLYPAYRFNVQIGASYKL